MGKLIDQCLEFPRCNCFRGLLAFNEILTEWLAHPNYPDNFTTGDLQYLILMDYFRLRCIAANAKSRLWRQRAEVLLLKPMYQAIRRQYP